MRNESGASGESRVKNVSWVFEERFADSARLNENKETDYHASLCTTLAPRMQYLYHLGTALMVRLLKFDCPKKELAGGSGSAMASWA